ncbi:MAG TPA: ParB/Srx family N-terminal domain-containing protein [Accumulibacter sp.]|jgi:hypothetical protein|nr:ParB/Srx family N-terminal domain-containing protein [Accumulibacter sp.]
MRTTAVILLGCFTLGSASLVEAKKNDTGSSKSIAECGKHTRVVQRNDDGIITAQEKRKHGCVIDVQALHPTQSAVGMDAVQCKAAKITSKAKAGKLDAYLLADNHWVPMVRGPGGKFYLTDHHHLSTAVWNADIKDKDKRVYAYLLADLSALSENAFWARMVKDHDTWLKNPAGEDIAPSQLPKSIAHLQDDPMRTLSAWVRGSCGYVKCDPVGTAKNDDELSCEDKFHGSATCAAADVYFLEFKWGSYLASVPDVKEALGQNATCSQQTPLDRNCLDEQYDRLKKALPAAMKAAAAPDALRVLGKNAGYNPTERPGIAQPRHCK